ncbi:MAG: hypothetical protein FGF53_09120 [Candidatus Brockarchaeota archaeon]|nr:hypothetical protein [Candidatus Brockarchaeota archaeon]MBO3808733.1 hypothetical protein [Candidatus Brockarchaeota archaeon]
MIPLIVLWFIILNENVFMSLIENRGFRIPLIIVAVAASISWTCGVLKKLRVYGVIQIKLLPGRLMLSIVFFTLLLTAKAVYSWQTQKWELFVGGVFFAIFCLLFLWKLVYSHPEGKAESRRRGKPTSSLSRN